MVIVLAIVGTVQGVPQKAAVQKLVDRRYHTAVWRNMRESIV